MTGTRRCPVSSVRSAHKFGGRITITRVLIKYIPCAIRECGSTLYVGMVNETRGCDIVKQ